MTSDLFGTGWSLTIWCDWSVRGLDLDCGSDDLEEGDDDAPWVLDLSHVVITGGTRSPSWT